MAMASDSAANKLLFRCILSECKQIKELCEAKIENEKNNEVSELLFDISCLVEDTAKLTESIADPICIKEFLADYKGDEIKLTTLLNQLEEKLTK